MHLAAPYQPRIDARKTLADALELALERTEQLVAEGLRSPATLAMQRQHAAWIASHAGDQVLEELDEAAIDRIVARELAGRRGRRVLRRSVAKRLSTLYLALRLARRQRWLERIPERPELPAGYRPDTRHLERMSDYLRLMAALPRKRRDWIAVAVWTGQHSSDVERMRVEDLDLDEMRVRVRNTKNRVPPWWMRCPRELERHFRARLTRRGPLEPLVETWSNVRRDLADACRRAGLPRLCPTSLRHTCGTWLVRRLGVVPAVWRVLGHASGAMLARVYGHALSDDLDLAIRELDRVRRGDRRGRPKRRPRR